jgi:hypothetical protein
MENDEAIEKLFDTIRQALANYDRNVESHATNCKCNFCVGIHMMRKALKEE